MPEAMPKSIPFGNPEMLTILVPLDAAVTRHLSPADPSQET